MTLLQHHILALTLTGVTTLGLGLLVFFAKPARRLNQVFGLYSLAISWWAFSESVFLSAPNLHRANLYSAIEWCGIFFIAPTFLHSVCLLVGGRQRPASRLLEVSYATSITFLFLHLGFGLITKPVQPVAYVLFFNRLSPLGYLVPLAFLIFVNLGLYELFHAYRRASGRRRTQLKYLFWGSLIGYLGGSPDWFLVFGFHIPGLNPFGIYGVPLYSLATTYAVLQHRLFDVNLVIRKSLVYSLLVTILTIGYFGLVYAVEKFFQLALGYQSIWLSLAAFALMALLFQPLKIGVQRCVDWVIFRVPQEALVKKVERLEEEARKSEKLKAVSALAAGLAHEIKNPLASIKTFTDYLDSHFADPDFRAKFKKIVGGEVERINLIVQQLLEFAKPVPPKLQPVEVPRIVDETLEFLNNEFVQRHIEVRRRYATTGRILGDRQQLKQVFLNLFLNSLDAMNGAGRLEIETAARGSELVVTIADNGAGITPKDLPHVFEPFYTTKATGTGLGLAVVHGIIKEHGGRIDVESRAGQGTTMKIRLPMAA